MLFTNLFQKHGFRCDYHHSLRSRCMHAIFIAFMPSLIQRSATCFFGQSTAGRGQELFVS